MARVALEPLIVVPTYSVIRRRIIRKQPPKIWVTANHQIRVPEVRVLSEKGENIGIMSTQDALVLAHDQNKDLVLVVQNAKPPVAKIIEISKYKYQVQQRDAENRKKSKSQDTKEVRFTPFMSDGDFQTKVRKVSDYLKDGDKVKVYVQFRGRQITKKDFGYQLLRKLVESTQEFSKVESEPRLMGNKLEAMLVPMKKKKEESNV